MLNFILIAVVSVTPPTKAPTTTPTSAPAVTPAPAIKMYALDCGHISFPDLALFSDTGDYDGQSGSFVAPCFLIRHPNGDLLWDAGLGDAAHDNPPKSGGWYQFSVPTTLRSQLQTLGLTYADIEIFGFSHAHFDHIGNANALTNATWLVPSREIAFAEQSPGGHPELLSARSKVKTVEADGDHDIFGDGSVVMLSTPGHTPGHHALLVKLPRAGAIILSGDLAHIRASYDNDRVPAFNDNRADTLASLDRIKRLCSKLKARFVVEHDWKDFEKLPKFPAALD